MIINTQVFRSVINRAVRNVLKDHFPEIKRLTRREISRMVTRRLTGLDTVDMIVSTDDQNIDFDIEES